MCTAPMYLFALTKMSGNAPDDPADGVLGDLEQGVIELLDKSVMSYITSDSCSIVLGQGNERASQWHQLICNPGTAYILWPQGWTLSCTRRIQGPLHQHKV